MKIICLQENLKDGLTMLERVISKNQTLPVLHNVLLKTEAGIIRAFATDLEIGIEVCIPCKVEKQGEVVIPVKIILQFIQNLPNIKITLEVKGNTIFIETEYNKIHIPTFSTREFPLIPRITEKNSIEMKDSGVLKNALQQVLNSVAVSYSLPEITGILFIVEKNNIRLVSTDSFRLSEKIIFQKDAYQAEKTSQFILPQKTAQELVRIIQRNEPISLKLDENQIVFTLQNITIISRLITGNYPNYEQIIPKTSKTKLTVQKDEFLSQIKLASIFSSKINDIKFSIKKNKKNITITSSDQVKGEFHASIPSPDVTGEDVEAVFNYKYLIDGLSNIEENEVLYELNGSASPALFKTKRGDYRYIIMPIKT